MCHPESFIFSCSDRGDSLHPLHRLLLLDPREQLLTVLQCWVLCMKSSSPATTASLLFSHSRTVRLRAWMLFHALMGAAAHLDGSLKGIQLPLMLLIFSCCFNFTLHFSGIPSSSQSLSHYNLQLLIFHPSTLLFLRCQCICTKDQPSFNHVHSWFSSLALVQFPFICLSPLGLCPTPAIIFCQNKHPEVIIGDNHAAI